MPAIKKIVVKNFKSFDNLTLEFDPGKNVLNHAKACRFCSRLNGAGRREGLTVFMRILT